MSKKPSKPSQHPLKKNKSKENSNDFHLQVWLPKDLYQWLRDSADADERALASFVRLVFRRVKDNPKVLQVPR